MSYHFPTLPTPSPETRADGWTPARQRRFLETLASTGVIRLACEAVRITPRSAYNLRIRRDGAAFRLGWDAAILIARARLADDLMARAITGQTETIRKDEDTHDITRHRHDNRLAMSMLARLDRMADSPAEGTDAALSPGASAALFVAVRMALHSTAARPHDQAQYAPFAPAQERCELRPERPLDLGALPPEEAATHLRGIWWDDQLDRWRTDFPAPPGFDGDENDEIYDIDNYERDLTPEEEDVLTAQQAEERQPYEDAAARARDAFLAWKRWRKRRRKQAEIPAKAPARARPICYCPQHALYGRCYSRKSTVFGALRHPLPSFPAPLAIRRIHTGCAAQKEGIYS
ncbi:MAG: hypothetical protein V4512_15380 [Pseudomonadota bacterium]